MICMLTTHSAFNEGFPDSMHDFNDDFKGWIVEILIGWYASRPS